MDTLAPPPETPASPSLEKPVTLKVFFQGLALQTVIVVLPLSVFNTDAVRQTGLSLVLISGASTWALVFLLGLDVKRAVLLCLANWVIIFGVSLAVGAWIFFSVISHH